MLRLCLSLCLPLVLALSSWAAEPVFPFVLPWDDASPGITDFSGLLEAPAGRNGRIRAGADGHFYAGERRIRFFGVNFTNAACFPAPGEAEVIAGRLAKFGINVVRFHFLDGEWGRPIWKRDQPGEFDPEQLDRLGFFVAQLKARGIYSNLNLLVGRRFPAGAGLPPEIAQLDWKECHIPGFFQAAHQELQKGYARRLLSHRNPHTGLTFAEDPAVAFVEIINEHGLIHSWLDGKVDHLPEVFLKDLRQQWNDWLQARYGDTAKLGTAWSAGEQPLGAEMLKNPGLREGLAGWTVEQHAGAEAAVTTLSGTLRIEVKQAGREDWHVQVNQTGLKLVAGQAYTFQFRARSAQARTIRVSVGQAHAPWESIGVWAALEVGPEWQDCQYVFTASQSDDQVRAGFGQFGEAGSVIELSGISLRPGGILGMKPGEVIEGGAMPLFRTGLSRERTPEAQRDWMRFLCDTEDRYWREMKRFLTQELGVRALITGTITGCAPVNAMAEMDWVDTHAYWQHPRWPRKQWDQDDWLVDNRPMINERGGVLNGLAAKRVLGKPHACTEYNHPAPNTFSSEMFPLLAAYASLQDWDAIYGYTYSHGLGKWDERKIVGFFEIDQHPAKMATAGAAAALFLRADVRPAAQAVVVPFSREREIDLLRSARPWGLVDAITAGNPGPASLIHRVALATEGLGVPGGALAPGVADGKGKTLASDTGELLWDLATAKRGVVTVNTARSKAVIGYGGGKLFALGDVVIEPGSTLQDGFSVITLTSGAGEGAAGRWLLTATGYVENTGMTWKNPDKSSVGRAWGMAPSRVEGVAAKLIFKGKSDLRVWALDERGQRRAAVPVQPVTDGASFAIGPQWQTLWYEITAGN